MADSVKLVSLFKSIKVNKIYSSPFERSIQTIKPISENKQIPIINVDDLHERVVGKKFESESDFFEFVKKQWDDFNYKEVNGESLYDTQKRNICFIEKIVKETNINDIIIGTHGTALSTIINYYFPEKNFEYFMSIAKKMPYIVKMNVENNRIMKFEEIEIK